MGLLTPPDTSHRDKENRCPNPLRVVWSQVNQYHPLTAGSIPKVPLASSASKHLLTKSILKIKNSDVLPYFPEEPHREITPEPFDPINDSKYLESPVSTIVSPNPSLRELIASYSVLTSRIKNSVTAANIDTSCSLLQPIRTKRDSVISAFIRDIGRAFVHPADTENISDVHCNERSVMLPSPRNSPRKKVGMSEEQVKYARDLCTTCHAVMKLLAIVFAFPTIYKVFTDDQLHAVLVQVLAIPMAKELPTPNARKTWALSIWLLQVQRLPSKILEPEADQIANALRRGIERQLGKEGKKGAASDGLKAVHDLAVYQPSTFVPAFAKIIPSILSSLLDANFSLRCQACHALGGLALGCSSLPLSAAHTHISKRISDFIATTPAASINTMKTSQEPDIIRTLRTTLSEVNPPHAAQGPAWALSVLASFVVLIGPALCGDTTLTKTLSALLLSSVRHSKSSVRALGCLVWRCIAWVYFLPPSTEIDVCAGGKEPLFLANQNLDCEMAESIPQKLKQCEGRESYWTLVQSVVDMGAGVAIVAGLLRKAPASDDDLKRAMSVIKVMVKRGGQTCGDAMEMVQQFFSFAAIETPMDSSKLLPPSLFSTVPGLLTVDYQSLVSTVRPIFDQCPRLQDVRSLMLEEAAKEWIFEDVVEIWREALACLQMPEDVETPIEITSIWGGLLRARVATLQDTGDDSSTSQFAVRTVEILIAILQDPSLNLTAIDNSTSSPKSSPTKLVGADLEPSHANATISSSNSALKLIVTRDLWSISRATIPRSLLGGAAKKLLAILMEQEHEFVGESDPQDNARRQWSFLCAEVLSVCEVEDMISFWGFNGESLKLREWSTNVRCLVWSSFVTKWKEIGGSWEGAAILLGIPTADVTTWDLSNDDFEFWDDFLCYVINQTLDQGVASTTVIDNVVDAIAHCRCPTFASSTRIADLLISHLDMLDMHQIPNSLLEFLDDVLQSTYPPEPRNKITSMWMIRSLTRLIDTCPAEIVHDLLERLQKGLSIWISDELGILNKEEYTYDVLPLYETILIGIRTISKGTETISRFSPILLSAFKGRHSETSPASEAFIDFWNAMCSTAEEPQRGWPRDIQICLRTVFGLSLADYGNSDSCLNNGICTTETIASTSNKHANANDTGDIEDANGREVLQHANAVTPHKRSRSPSVKGKTVSKSSIEEQENSPFLPKHTPTSSTKAKNLSDVGSPESSSSALFVFQTIDHIAPSVASTPPRPSSRSIPPRTHCSPSTVTIQRMPLGNMQNISPSTFTPDAAKSKGQLSILGKRRASDSTLDFTTKKSKKEMLPASLTESAKTEHSADVSLRDDARVSTSHLPAIPMRVSSTIAVKDVRGDSRRHWLALSHKQSAVFLDAVEVPTLREVRRRRRRQTTSLKPLNPQHRDFKRARSVARSVKRGVARESNGLDLKIKRRKALGGHGRSMRSVKSVVSSLIGVQNVTLGSDDSIHFAINSPCQVPKDLSSDDDPHDGQVTPHHLISPALSHARMVDYDPPSDDSNVSISPSRDAVARRLERGKLLRTPEQVVSLDKLLQ